MNKKLIAGVVVVVLIVIGVMTFQNNSKDNETTENNTSQKEVVQNEEGNPSQGEISNESAEKKESLIRKSLSRTISTGEVEFEIVFTNPLKNDKEYWMFQMFTNTHSVDLDAIPFGELIHFIDDEGNKIEDGIEFTKKGSGHHLEQYIKLPKHIDGKDTILKEFKNMKLVIRDIENTPETVFAWDMTMYPEIFDH